MPTRRDYDTDPDRYRLGVRTSAAYGSADLYAEIVRLLGSAGVTRALDVGCGAGALAAAASGTALRVFGVDASEAMVRGASRHGAVLHADAEALPVADGSVEAVVSVNVLDHLPEPVHALRQARRVLAPGGLFVAGTISRTDSPELAPHWRPARTPFDAEDAKPQVAAVFGSAESRPWDAPLVSLPDRSAIADYLLARFVPPAEADRIATVVADRGPLPLRLTKRGALVLARRLAG